MKTYADLKLNGNYLIREEEGVEIILISPVMETELCFLVEDQDEYGSMFWRKKEDTIFEIVEELTDEQVIIYESFFEDEEDYDFDEEDEIED